MAVLATQEIRPVVRPLLDQDTGACPVYAQRPVACRTYGFYVERDKGLYCHDIEARVSAGQLDDVLWGNQEGVNQQLKRLGETHSLVDWFQRGVIQILSGGKFDRLTGITTHAAIPPPARGPKSTCHP